MIDHLSITCAHFGSISESVIPGTLVDMVPNSPRYSTGASGLGSHMSIWLGPPRIHRMMTDGRRVGCEFWSVRASLCNSCDSVNPVAPRMPALTKLRRSRRVVERKSAQPSLADMAGISHGGVGIV